MKSTSRKNRCAVVKLKAKPLTSSLSLLAIEKKLKEIKQDAGAPEMREWQLGLFNHPPK